MSETVKRVFRTAMGMALLVGASWIGADRAAAQDATTTIELQPR